jgi:hypothetical protein
MEDRDGCIILGLDNVAARKVAIACNARMLLSRMLLDFLTRPVAVDVCKNVPSFSKAIQ